MAITHFIHFKMVSYHTFNYKHSYLYTQRNVPIATPVNSENLRIMTQSFGPDFFCYLSLVLKNLSIMTEHRVKPLFCDIDERGK